MSEDRKISPLERELQLGDHKYEDITTDGLEGVTIERLPRVPSSKYIKMRPAFYEQPIEKQAAYLMSLASAMNSALDIIQQERNSIVELARKQEAQIIRQQKEIAALQHSLQNTLQSMNVEANQRAAELQEAKREIQQLKAH